MLVRQTLLALLMTLLCASSVPAQDLEEMEQSTAAAFAAFLSEQLSKDEGLTMKFEFDIQKASGVVDLTTSTGIIVVPAKDLNEEEPDPAVETEKGSPFAYLFMSQRFNPLVEDKPAEEKKLRSVEIMGPDGNSVKATGLVLAARHIEGEEWRLYAYGAEEKPLVDVQIFDAEEPKAGEVSIHVQDVKEEKATLVVTIFGKYEASIPISFKAE